MGNTQMLYNFQGEKLILLKLNCYPKKKKKKSCEMNNTFDNLMQAMWI
jgi:hypothetical protein